MRFTGAAAVDALFAGLAAALAGSALVVDFTGAAAAVLVAGAGFG